MGRVDRALQIKGNSTSHGKDKWIGQIQSSGAPLRKYEILCEILSNKV